jgi:hypothetical protein
MHVISAETLEALGRFPANREGHSVDAREVLKSGAYVVDTPPHRLLRCSTSSILPPADADNGVRRSESACVRTLELEMCSSIGCDRMRGVYVVDFPKDSVRACCCRNRLRATVAFSI